MAEKKAAVLIGRFCPIHLGHESVIDAMRASYGENCLIGIGSANHPISIRHFFSYEQRRGFILNIFPELKVFGLPDFPTDDEWMIALDDIVRLSGVEPSSVTFFGGCQEEVDFFYRSGRKVEIMNRFDGSTPKISATEVRDALIGGRTLDGLLNPNIAHSVHDVFRTQWEMFKKI